MILAWKLELYIPTFTMGDKIEFAKLKVIFLRPCMLSLKSRFIRLLRQYKSIDIIYDLISLVSDPFQKRFSYLKSAISNY